MRSTEEVMHLLTTFAHQHATIRAMYMNGSRVNTKVKVDKMQDYDVVYVVTSTLPFIDDKSWIKVFGEIAVMQEPDCYETSSLDKLNHYTYLLQFKDGVRLDITFQSIPYCLEVIHNDKLTKIILDKDHLLPELEPASDIDYIVKHPTYPEFRGCCNEFWWVSTYIAKGLWRKELLYAMDHLNFYVRPMLLKILSWRVGYDNNFSLSVGKCYKYLPDYLTTEELEKLTNTYPLLDIDKLWEALYTMMDFFKEKSIEIGKLLNYQVDEVEIKNTIEYINKVKNNEL